MQIDPQALDRLSQLELEQYAGNLRAIQGDDRTLYEQLFEIPVSVKLTAQKGICDDSLYEICVKAQGGHESFLDLRRTVTKELGKKFDTPGQNLLTISFNGIYVGDPEDLLNHRNGRPEGILYPTRGLGEKLAEVAFISGYPEI